MKPFLTIIFVPFASLLYSLTAFAQENKDNTAGESIALQQYLFKARTAMPARGRNIQLTSEYSMTVTKDSIEAHLPYFGRAYTAPIGQSSGGIEFISTDFSYDAEERKKGGWRITIKPNDAEDIQQIFLNLSENGYGTLQVTSLNKQAISFSGVVEKLNRTTN